MRATWIAFLALALFTAVLAATKIERPENKYSCDGEDDCYCPAGLKCRCGNGGNCYCGNAASCMCANAGDCFCGNTAVCALQNLGNSFCQGVVRLDAQSCYSMNRALILDSKVYCVPVAMNASTLPIDWSNSTNDAGESIYQCKASRFSFVVMLITIPISVVLAGMVHLFCWILPVIRRAKLKMAMIEELKNRIEKERTDPQRGAGMQPLDFEYVFVRRWIRHPVRFAVLMCALVLGLGGTLFLYLYNRYTNPLGMAALYIGSLPAFIIAGEILRGIRTGLFVSGNNQRIVLTLDPARGEIRGAEAGFEQRQQLRFVEQLANVTHAVTSRPFHNLAADEQVTCVYLVRADESWFTSPCLTCSTPDTAEALCGQLNQFLNTYTNRTRNYGADSIDIHREHEAVRLPYRAPRWHAHVIPVVYEAPPVRGQELDRDFALYGVARKDKYGTAIPLLNRVA